MSDREGSPEIIENDSDHQSVEEKSASPERSPAVDNDIEERRSRSRSRSHSRSRSFTRRRRSYSRSSPNENAEDLENETQRSHSRGRRYRHYGSRSRSRSPKHHRYSRSRSRSYSPRRSCSPQYSPKHSYYGDDKYYRYGGKSRYSGRSYARSPMSSRRRHVGTRDHRGPKTDNDRRSRVNEQQRDNPEPSRCLGVFGLSLYTQERELRDVFGKYGPIEDVQVVYDAQSGRSRGFAFVYFEETDDAKAAKERCNGQEIDGRKIRVDYSITKRAHTPTPGIYMGKPTYPRYGGRENHRDSYYRDRGHSPSPYYRHRYSRSRSRSYSPRKYGYY